MCGKLKLAIHICQFLPTFSNLKIGISKPVNDVDIHQVNFKKYMKQKYMYVPLMAYSVQVEVIPPPEPLRGRGVNSLNDLRPIKLPYAFIVLSEASHREIQLFHSFSLVSTLIHTNANFRKTVYKLNQTRYVKKDHDFNNEESGPY